MTDETQGAAQADAEDTAQVLAHAALEGDKTFLTPKEEAQAEPEGEDLGEDATAAKPDEGEAKPKPKQTAQERINELTREKHETAREKDREIEFWKAKATQPAKADETPAPAAQPTGDGKPDPANYAAGAYDPEYIDHLTDWKAQAAVNAALAARDERQTVSTKLGTFQSKVAELYPDGEPEGLTAFRALDAVDPNIQQLLLESDVGPKVADHLGSNPADLARLSGLSPALQGREFGKLETRLSDPPKATPKTATDAPEPAPQARGSGGQFKVAADTNDFEAFQRQHMPGR